VKDAKQPVESDVRRIDRKLKYCRNPGLQDEGKGKRERKEKQRHKRGSHDVQMVNAVDNHALYVYSFSALCLSAAILLCLFCGCSSELYSGYVEYLFTTF
jgi:hypothetical protein